jgi:hypothetical protein
MSTREVQDLGDGLVLRQAGPGDTDALASFYVEVNRQLPNPSALAVWTHDLVERPLPTANPTLFTLVEDVRTGRIVSSLNLIGQTWSYDGIEFLVGRPECVSTHPDYRRRGLVRRQFELIHEWSRRRGEQVLAVSGIPYIYRQFGYETLWALDQGYAGHEAQLMELAGQDPRAYRVRPAADADVDFLSELYRQASARSLVVCVRDRAMWTYDIAVRSPGSDVGRQVGIVETTRGNPVGLVAHRMELAEGRLDVVAYERLPGISWSEVTPAVSAYLLATAREYARAGGEGAFAGVAMCLGASHPVYSTLQGWAPTRFRGAWYMRVPDLPAFIRHIRPALERNLSRSPLARHSGTLILSFYRHDLRLEIDAGRIAKVEDGYPPSPERADAAFADLAFLQLVFGYRSVAELDFYYPDCWVGSREVSALLDALFPKRGSYLWSVE